MRSLKLNVPFASHIVFSHAIRVKRVKPTHQVIKRYEKQSEYILLVLDVLFSKISSIAARYTKRMTSKMNLRYTVNVSTLKINMKILRYHFVSS